MSETPSNSVRIMTDPSPVVPSVGAVPVEVPQRVLDAARSIDILPGLLERVPEAVRLVNLWRKDMVDRGRMDDEDALNEALGVATVVATWAQSGVIAARVRAKERQRAEREQQWANQHLLTVMAMLVGCTVDELVDQMWMDPHGQYEITDTIASLRAQIAAAGSATIASLRAQIAAAGSAIPPTEPATCVHGSSRAHSYTHLGRLPKLRCPGPAEQLRTTGSAVPVATPPTGRTAHDATVAAQALMGVVGEIDDRRTADLVSRRAMQFEQEARDLAPVATPADPVDEVVCPNCEHTIRARMSDQPGPCTSECGKPADQTCLQWACRKAGADLAAPAEQDDEPLTYAETVACLADERGEPDWTPPAGQDGRR